MAGKKKLSAKQIKFIHEYLIDFNGAQAAIRAGYPPGRAKQHAWIILQRPNVKKALAKLMEQARSLPGVADNLELLLGYTRDLRFDPRKLYDEDGNPLPPHLLDDETALAITGLKVTEKIAEEGSGESTTCYRNQEYKFPDKNRVRDSLARIQGLLKDKTEVTGKDGKPIEVGFTPESLLAEIIKGKG